MPPSDPATRVTQLLEAIAAGLGVRGEDALDALGRRVRAMQRDGQLICNREAEYGLLDRMDLVRGRVLAHRDGFGFLVPDDASGDLFLSPREMRALMHDDRVVARIARIDPRGRREGAVVEVLERHGFDGWYVLEQDTALDADPAPGDGPIVDARASVAYLAALDAGQEP